MLKPFFIWDNRILVQINPDHVVCLQVEGNYTRICLADDKSHLVRCTLTSALKKLTPGLFLKVHRGFAASIYYIDKIHHDMLVIGTSKFPIAKKYRASLLKKINILK